MPTVEERVAYLEGMLGEHTRGLTELRDMLIHLDSRVSRLDQKLDRRIDALDQKVDRRVDGVDRKLDALDRKVDHFREELSGRIAGLDQRMSRQFLWLLGVQVAVLLAVIGALVGT